MKVKEIPFVGRRRPSDINEIPNLSNLGWNGTCPLPIPIRFNDILCTHCVVSNYGALRFTQASNSQGKYHYWPVDKKLPMGIDDTEKGWMIIPWGAPMSVVGCGTGIYLYEQDGTVVFDYAVKSSFDTRNKFLFRVEFPIAEPNIIRCFYYHCVTGYDTFIGIAKEPDNTIQWPLKENQPYMKKALEFDVSAEDDVQEQPDPHVRPTDPPADGYKWEFVRNPFGGSWLQVKKETEPEPEPEPDPTPEPDPGTWETVYTGKTYRVQEPV